MVERHDTTASSVTDSHGSSWISHGTGKLYWKRLKRPEDWQSPIKALSIKFSCTV